MFLIMNTGIISFPSLPFPSLQKAPLFCVLCPLWQINTQEFDISPFIFLDEFYRSVSLIFVANIEVHRKLRLIMINSLPSGMLDNV